MIDFGNDWSLSFFQMIRNDPVILQASSVDLDRRRFYVLFLFAFLAFNQCWIWLTFSPIARSTEQYYHISETTIDLLLNWGPIIFIPCLPLTYFLLNRPHGLRKCVVVLAIMDFFAAFVRVIPSVVTDPSSPHFTSLSMVFLHLGQIINAACGPLVMAPVSQLSCLWFAPNERTRATTIAIFANNFGLTMGFLINPWMVSLPEHVPRVLYLHLALAFLACILSLLFFPSSPKSPPSAAAILLLNPQTSTSFWIDLKQCLIKPSFLLIAGAGGLMSGAFSTWASLFDVLLKSEDYTEQQAGWFGFGASLAGIVGGLVWSSLADTRRFRRSLKSLILAAFFGAFLAILWFELSVRTLFYDRALLPSNALTIGLSTAFVGLCAGAACPLVYEALAELMYPLPESLSASILVQWVNVICLTMLFIAPNRAALINFLVFISIILCFVMVCCARFTYQRSDEDARRKSDDEEDTREDYGTFA